jgi:hypothetical protein
MGGKRVVIVHGWGATPDSDWHPWLKRMLIERGFEVIVPQMPDSDNPHINTWVPYLAEVAGRVDENTYFVGHSIGCQAIIRYAAGLLPGIKIAGAIFVAGWFHLNQDGMTDEEKEVVAEWSYSTVNLPRIREHISKSVALFSDNDPYVPISEADIFERELGSKIIVHPKRGHFTSEDGVLELHAALNEILKMAK